MKAIDLKLQKLLKHKRTGWIVVSPNFKKIIAFSKKLNDLVRKTEDKKKEIYYLSVQKKQTVYKND